MTRKNTFRAEGPSAMDDIRSMLSGYEPAGEAESVTVEIEYAEDGAQQIAAAAPAQPVDEQGDPLPRMKTGTRLHRILEALAESQAWLTNPEIADRIGVEDHRVQSSTSDLHRSKEMIAARRKQGDDVRFQYHINSRGEKMLERLGPADE